MTHKNRYRKTLYACFTGYVVQAIINNFAPLLFVTFQNQYQISLDKIALLITFNFGVQIAVDLFSPPIINRAGARTSMVAAHAFCAAGIICLSFLPDIFPSPFAGLLLSSTIYAVGGGLLEVLVSPVVEACPTENKSAVMSLLHSFYCWGCVGVILVSTLFFAIFGLRNWKIMALLWALVPIVNGLFFAKAPMPFLLEEGGKGLSLRELLSSKLFWILGLIMLCAGAGEQSVSQWASAFAEEGLGISKTMGDLLGPTMFAVLMGFSRVLYAKCSGKIRLENAMLISGFLCVCGYLLISISPMPILSLLGCGLCGFSIGIMWPGTFSLATRGIARGGTTMFALLSFAGDLGCGSGPTLVGFISNASHGNLQSGLLFAGLFPLFLVLFLFIYKKQKFLQNT